MGSDTHLAKREDPSTSRRTKGCRPPSRHRLARRMFRPRLSGGRRGRGRLELLAARPSAERPQVYPAHHALHRLVGHRLTALGTALLGLVVTALACEQSHWSSWSCVGNRQLAGQVRHQFRLSGSLSPPACPAHGRLRGQRGRPAARRPQRSRSWRRAPRAAPPPRRKLLRRSAVASPSVIEPRTAIVAAFRCLRQWSARQARAPMGTSMYSLSLRSAPTGIGLRMAGRQTSRRTRTHRPRRR